MTYRTLPIPTYIVPTSDTQSQAVLHAQVTSSHSKTSYCSCSVVKSHPTLCNPMDCSTPGFPVLHYLPEFAQTHVHRVSDAIQPSYPLSPPSLPVFNLSQIKVFYSESALGIRWPEYWSSSFSISPSNEYSGLISFRKRKLFLKAIIGTTYM